MTGQFGSDLRARARRRLLNPTGHLSAFAVAWLVAIVAASLSYYHYYHEGWRETIIFAGAITTGLIALLTLMTRRVLFSIVVVAALITIVVIASGVKRQYIDMVLHAYDVVFYMTSLSTLSFLWVDHKIQLLGGLAAVAFSVLIGRLVFTHDSSRVARPASAVVALVCGATALWASDAKGGRDHTLFYWDSLYLSSFYASWSETMETLWRGQLIEAAKTQPEPLFKIPADCTPGERPPHIILIHQESVVPPSHFPSIDYDRKLDPFFNSFDGKLHNLRVETYGGASWLTEFSVLTGVSTYSFGGMRTFVQSLMQGKIRDTLPQNLARCGYRNSVFYPVDKDFVSNGKFYAAIGMPEIFDYKAQGAKRYNERDAFYYANTLKHFEAQLQASKTPLFTYILTVATHLPYTYVYEPQETVAGGGPGSDPEMSEYLRRLAMAKLDYDAFRAELARRFPSERFLIVQYGDHQPITTRPLLGYNKETASHDVALLPDSRGFLTYYSVEGINYDPPPLPTIETLEVPYLGAVLLQAARLPLSEAYRERLRLMRACEGRYYTCPNKGAILSFHRRLIDSGVVDAR
jgi:phosphoglycerol transferase MdoB-like AlkP superfamily enzyme